MSIEKWQARIHITQIPVEIETEPQWDYYREREIIRKKTLLTNPFQDQTTYGLELSLNNEFSWTFFFCENEREYAFSRAFSYLENLKIEYLGLDGTIELVPTNSLKLSPNTLFYEITLPAKPNQVEIISKIVQLFRTYRIGDLTFYIFWERDDTFNSFSRLIRGLEGPHFKLKIYFRITPFFAKKSEVPAITAYFDGMLNFLTLNIKNVLSKQATIDRIEDIIWPSIKNSEVILESTIGLPEISRSVVFPALIDFSFPENCPIRKANLLKSPNITSQNVSKDDKNHIWIGQIINNGIVESNPATIPINHFGKSVFIGGQMGAGKTYLVAQIAREFYKKAPHIGILYLNTGKPNQELFYKHDACIKYGDPDFRIPYYVEGSYAEKSLQETATYLAASAGLREPVDKVLRTVMASFLRVNGALPLSLRDLFKGLRKWYKLHRYDAKFQARITIAIENRVLSLLSDPVLEQCTQLSSEGNIPTWFTEWQQGKKIYIDISMCDAYVKILLTNAIFQMIRTLTPNYEAEELTHLIVIDEAHVILEKSNELFTNSDFYVAKEQLERIFNSLLREFRSKGLGFIICDVTPSDLFMSATKLPSLKILFRLGEQCIRRFTSMVEDYKYLMLLETRQALVLNGNNADRYPIETVALIRKKTPTISVQSSQGGG